MGDASDHSKLVRWLESDCGRRRLGKYRRMLVGKTIKLVQFRNRDTEVTLVLEFSDGSVVELSPWDDKLEAYNLPDVPQPEPPIVTANLFKDTPNGDPVCGYCWHKLGVPENALTPNRTKVSKFCELCAREIYPI